MGLQMGPGEKYSITVEKYYRDSHCTEQEPGGGRILIWEP